MNLKQLLTKFTGKRRKKSEEPFWEEPKQELPAPPPVPEPEQLSKPMVVKEYDTKKWDEVNRLTEEEKMQLCKLVAEFKRPFEVQKFAREAWGKNMNHQSITYYFKADRWQPIIQRFREVYLSGVMDIPIANKKVRLERLEEVYESTDNDPNIAGIDRRRQKLDVLRNAREEMDERTQVSNTFNTQIINLSDEELHERKKQILAQIKAIPAPSPLDRKALPIELSEQHVEVISDETQTVPAVKRA